MTDSPAITGPVQARALGHGYRAAREVEVRAATLRQGRSPEEKKALARLDATLRSGRPPKAEAPRGFYLDIRV